MEKLREQSPLETNTAHSDIRMLEIQLLDILEGIQSPLLLIEAYLQLDGSQLPSHLSGYKNTKHSTLLTSQVKVRKMEQEVTQLFKSRKGVDAAQSMKALLDFAQDVQDFDFIASRRSTIFYMEQLI